MAKLAQKSKPSPPKSRREIVERLAQEAGAWLEINYIEGNGNTEMMMARFAFDVLSRNVSDAKPLRRKATERRPTKRQTTATTPPPAQKGK